MTSARQRPLWRRVLIDALVSGGVASVLSAAALGLCGRVENRSAAGPVNGPSQWVWGRGAARRRDVSLRHTLVGYLIHHAMATGWAALHERCYGPVPHGAARELAAGAATAASACFVDYRLTPLRLRPGFETQLSKRSLLVVYASFAVGLAIARSRAR